MKTEMMKKPTKKQLGKMRLNDARIILGSGILDRILGNIRPLKQNDLINGPIITAINALTKRQMMKLATDLIQDSVAIVQLLNGLRDDELSI